MAIKVSIKPQVLFFEQQELERWVAGDRTEVSDEYLRRLNRGSRGFGEYIVGRHFEKQGYRYIHHDFDLFGANKPNKYPESEDIFRAHFGEKLKALRSLHGTFGPFADPHRHPLETPDLLLYKPETNDLRFVECKRDDTGDELNHKQVVGLLVVAALLRCPVDVVVVRRAGSSDIVAPIEFSYGAAANTEPADSATSEWEMPGDS